MMRTLVASSLVLVVGAAVLGGSDGIGRVALYLGMPATAGAVSQDTRLQGIAAYRRGDFATAAQAFEEAGDLFNAGLAHTRDGDYAAALVAWEQHLVANPSDREAQANHRIVSAFISGTELDVVARPEDRNRDGPEAEAPEGQGKGRAVGEGDSATNDNTAFWMPEVTSEGLRRVPHVFDAQFMAANGLWLDTLEDEPGLYLRARLAAEQKLRVQSGAALPPADDLR